MVLKRQFIGNPGGTSAFHVHCSGVLETELQPFSWKQSYRVNTVLLVVSWVLKRLSISDTGRPLHVHSGLLGDKALSQYNSFIGKMVLKRLCISDTGEHCLYVHCSGLLGDRALSHSPRHRTSSQYDRLSGKMVLKRLHVGDTGEDSALQIYCSGLGRQSFSPRRVLQAILPGDKF